MSCGRVEVAPAGDLPRQRRCVSPFEIQDLGLRRRFTGQEFGVDLLPLDWLGGFGRGSFLRCGTTKFVPDNTLQVNCELQVDI